MPVVVMDPVVQGPGALGRALVGEAVGPFAQGALDEALGLAVGLGPVSTGELVANAVFKAGLGEVAGMEGGRLR
jgi:hypothetical protein